MLENQLTRKLRRLGGSLEKLREEIGLLAIGTATDPYQPIEARRGITRGTLYKTAYPPRYYIDPLMSQVHQLMSEHGLPPYHRQDESRVIQQSGLGNNEGRQMVLPI